MRADLPKQLYVIQIEQPVCIVDEKRFVIGKIDETAHLLFEAVNIVLNLFRCQHFPHIRFAGRIPDHTGAAAQKGDGLVAGLL